MFKYFSLLPAFTLALATHSQQPPAIEWQRCLGGAGEDIAYAIQQTTDGGYIVTGSSNSNNGDVSGNHGGNDFWVVKLTSGGELAWQHSLGGQANETSRSIRQTADGGFIAVGNTHSTDGDVSGNHGSNDMWIIGLDHLGALQWQRCLGGSSEDAAHALALTTDGGIIIAGETASNDGDVSGNNGGNDVWVIKLDASGEVSWQHPLGGPGFDLGYSIQQSTDNGIIVVGVSGGNGGDVSGHQGGGFDLWVIRLNEAGDLQWQQCLGGSGLDMGFAVETTDDGGCVVVSDSNSNDGDVSGAHGGTDQWVVKLDGDGVIQWQRCIGGPGNDRGRAIRQTTDGGYIVAGVYGPEAGGVVGSDALLTKLDAEGEILWQKHMGGTGTEQLFSVVQTADGGYIVAGSTDSNDGDVSGNQGGLDFWVVKIAPDHTGVSIEYPDTNLSLFPNPTSGDLNLRFGSATSRFNSIGLFDGTGRMIMDLRDGQPTTTPYLWQFSIADLPAGIYYVHGVVDGWATTQKVVKL